jgi:hypothetical protein
LVLDLTATTRYYDNSEWAQHGVRYEKIFCQGHNIHQQPQLVEKFINIIDKYFDYYKDERRIVGVHCTHGINRTGYLICRYLMQRKGWEATKAIASFEASRGLKIERPEYITALHNYKSSGTTGRKNSIGTDLNDTTWRTSNSSWRNSDAKSYTWRPRIGSSDSRNLSSIKPSCSSDSWKTNDCPNFDNPSSSMHQQLDSVDEKKCQEATKKLRGLLNIDDKNALPSKK